MAWGPRRERRPGRRRRRILQRAAAESHKRFAGPEPRGKADPGRAAPESHPGKSAGHAGCAAPTKKTTK